MFPSLRSLSRLEVAAPWFAAVVLFVPIGVLLAISSVNRYAADDWCWPVYVRERSFFALQGHMYGQAFGRWASTGLLSGVAYLGSWTASVLPALGVGLWLAIMAWFWREVLGRFLPALIISQLIVLGVLLPAPEQAFDGVVWQTGMLTYMPPIIIAFAGAAAALRLRSPIVAALAAFLAAGFNESFMALEIVTLAAVLVLVDRQHRTIVLSALAAAILCGVIVFLSPGNEARRAAQDPMPLSLLPIGVLYRQVVLLIPAIPISLAFATIAGFGFSGQMRLPRKLGPVLILALALSLSYVALAPAIYGTNFLPGRVAVNVLLPLVIGAFLLGVRLGASRLSQLGAPAFALSALGLTILACSQFLPYYTRFDVYRQELALQDARLASTTPGSAVVLEDPAVAPYDTLWQLRRDSEFLINRCVSDYYGLDSIRIT